MKKILLPILFTIGSVLAENEEAAAEVTSDGGNAIGKFFSGPNGVMIVAMVAIWFFMIRPAMKKEKDKQKAAEELRDSLKKGDNVITAGGIYGTVKKVEGEKVTLTVSKNCDLTVLKTSIGADESTFNEALSAASE